MEKIEKLQDWKSQGIRNTLNGNCNLNFPDKDYSTFIPLKKLPELQKIHDSQNLLDG